MELIFAWLVAICLRFPDVPAANCLEIWWNTAQSSCVGRLEMSFTCLINVVCM